MTLFYDVVRQQHHKEHPGARTLLVVTKNVKIVTNSQSSNCHKQGIWHCDAIAFVIVTQVTISYRRNPLGVFFG